MEIKILSSGCANCERLEANLTIALERCNKTATIMKIEDPEEILHYGVNLLPVLVIDDEPKVSGAVPTIDELIELLKECWNRSVDQRDS